MEDDLRQLAKAVETLAEVVKGMLWYGADLGTFEAQQLEDQANRARSMAAAIRLLPKRQPTDD